MLVNETTPLLPLHRLLTVLDAWRLGSADGGSDAISDALAAVLTAYGVRGARLAVNTPSLPALDIGVGSLRGGYDDATNTMDFPLEGAGGGSARVWIDGAGGSVDGFVGAIELALEATASRHQVQVQRQQ